MMKTANLIRRREGPLEPEKLEGAKRIRIARGTLPLGAVPIIWCCMRGWDKNRQRAVYQPYILAMQLMTVLGLEFAGHAHTYDLLLLQYVPAAPLGAYCGLVIFKQLNDRHFNLIIYAFLLISGVTLIAK